MKERTYVDDVDRSVYDIKDKENDAYRIKSGLDASIVEKISKENNIPVSAFEEVFGDKKKKNHFFRILEGSNVLADDNLKFIKKLGR